MDWNNTLDWQSIRRIVAVLLALADLAERASGRSVAVRGLVLWLLRSGEVLARDCLAGLTPHAADRNDPLPFTGGSATEAMRLATSFRKLAAALTALAAAGLATVQRAVAFPCGSAVCGLVAAPLALLRTVATAAERLDSS